MFPLRDLNPTRRRPLVTWTLIATNLVIWVFAWVTGAVEPFVWGLGVVPRSLLSFESPAVLLTPVTSLFMHAGWAHLLGNLWFLHIFGDNVEDHLGHARFLVFYVLAGLCAVVAHVVMEPLSPLPLVGASGAIAGVLGAYMMRFPRAPILAWFLVALVELPAFVFLFVWFGYQLLMTFGGSAGGEGGVAFAAHAGGFVAGAALERLLAPGRDTLAERERARQRALAEARARALREHRAHRRFFDPD